MPLIQQSSYRRAPLYQFNGHLQTILPGTFRKVALVYERERLELADGDFVDLDWVDKGRRRLVLLTHGLEGNAERHYMKGMAKLFTENGWDALAWNCRSCSGEMNRHFRLYHHGEIGDFNEVIQHALRLKNYEQVALVGFSMGGNIMMKYLGVHGKYVPEPIKKAVAFSSPTDLESGAAWLDHPSNRLYKKRFLTKLSAKVLAKAAQFPGKLNTSKLASITVWRDFDEYFSAPLCGYQNAAEFYQDASARNFMQGIAIPTLLVNAQNDPILTPRCSPVDLSDKHRFLHLEIPLQGGHVGFELRNKPYMWSEYRALEFCSED
ncbi:MAG TPA: alpha/beta fold hydrolase [Saprospiraceae bacterium]|nr:alpha/beta fold hydrolase [Saprospiraceae bacterium]HMP14566.1 alpha/beta fold hydrolase [Saprospiraceae bacterium]